MTNQSRHSDEELIEELKNRFEFNRNALQNLSSLTRKLEEVNQKLQDSEALKSHFLSNIRNEINNPLTSIMGLSSQLMSGQADPQKAAETAGMVYSEAFSLDFQLRNIFMAAELEAGETSPAFAQVDICKLVEGAIELFSHQAASKQVPLDAVMEPGTVFATDAQKLQIILNNLLANAIEFSPEGARVEIRVGQKNDSLQLAVRDFGCGIAKEQQAVVFDRFRQLDSGTTKTHPGHGLGLSITSTLTELLGGSIELQSDPGQGSTFTLTIPQADLADGIDTIAQDGNFFLFGEEEKF